MVRSKPLRGGRPQATSAPTRRQLQQLATTSDSVQTSSDVESSTRKAALDRRRALTTAGKAAQLGGAPVGGGRIRSSKDVQRPAPSQPGWVRREKAATRAVPFNLSRSSLPITHRRHPLTDAASNARLQAYEQGNRITGHFDMAGGKVTGTEQFRFDNREFQHRQQRQFPPTVAVVSAPS